MNQRIYLCGAINDNKNYTEDFEKAETIVSKAFKNYDVVNPSHIEAITDRIKELATCNYLVIIDDFDGEWKKNTQIQKELSICSENNIRILHLSLLGGI